MRREDQVPCAHFLTFPSILPSLPFKQARQRLGKAQRERWKLQTASPLGECHDLTSCSIPSDLLLGVPAALTLKNTPLGEPGMTGKNSQMQHTPPSSHSINQQWGDIIVKQAKHRLCVLSWGEKEARRITTKQKTLPTPHHCGFEHHMEKKGIKRLSNYHMEQTPRAARWQCLFV